MNESETIYKMFEERCGEIFTSPRNLFDRRKRRDFSVEICGGEVSIIFAYGKPLAFRAILISEAFKAVCSDDFIPVGAQSAEDPASPSMEYSLIVKYPDLDQKVIPYIADMLVLSGHAEFGWAFTKTGRRVQGIRTSPRDNVRWQVLVTYATKHGSTRQTASEVAKIFAAGGVSVDLKPVQEVDDVRPYDVVILGSPIYMGKMLPAAIEFVDLHQETLRKRRLALFLLGLAHFRDGDKAEKDAEAAAEEIRRFVEPVTVCHFTGRKPSCSLPLREKVILHMMKIPKNDIQDLESVRSWAKEIKTLMLTGI